MFKKRKKVKVGDFVKVPLGEGNYSYGRVLEDPLYAFYDIKTKDALDILRIVDAKILFKVWVSSGAVKSGRWEIVGNLPLESGLEISPRFYKVDPITGKYSIYGDEDDIPATRDDCIGLERASVWDPEHIEDRLRDYFAGIPNEWEMHSVLK